MGKILGIVLLLVSTAGGLFSWMQGQKERMERLDQVILFLRKTIFSMETEKIKLISYFSEIEVNEEVLKRCLTQISYRLSQNVYPNGQSAWEEVFKEEEQNLGFDKETFGVLMDAGNGFFGRSKAENICFLQKSVEELEQHKHRIKKKDAEERKVWVPVGMLGAVMLVIIFM